MNEHTKSRWSDLDIERYHDGELPTEQRAAMTTDLFTDEELRGRLDRIGTVDELGRRALLGNVLPRTGVLPLSKNTRRAILATAATLALVVTGLATRTLWRRPLQPPVAISAPVPVKPKTYSERSLALVIPVSAEFRFTSLRNEPQQAAPKLTPEEEAIQKALAQGRAHDALRLLAKAKVQDRISEWSKLGEMMQSAQSARSAILLLPLDQQIEIVRVWSDEPSLRPVVFERLEELLRDPESASAAKLLRSELAMIPQLSSWVQSYTSAR